MLTIFITIYYTNIFDDECKKDRQANMISMAASRKILAFYESMSKYSKCFSNESLHIISLGITNYQYNPRIFPQYKSRKHSFIIHYGTFVRFKIIRDIISIFWAVIKTIRIVRRNDFVVFYNWSPHFLVPVFLCRILQAKCILDIEDGPPEKISSPSDLVQYILYYFFSFLCKHGTIIAANSLLRFSKTNKHLVFYSVSKSSNSNKNYLDNIVKIHFGGSLMKETGFHLLRDAIEIINNNKQSKKINFTITGYLDSKSEEYRKLNEFNN